MAKYFVDPRPDIVELNPRVDHLRQSKYQATDFADSQEIIAQFELHQLIRSMIVDLAEVTSEAAKATYLLKQHIDAHEDNAYAEVLRRSRKKAGTWRERPRPEFIAKTDMDNWRLLDVHPRAINWNAMSTSQKAEFSKQAKSPDSIAELIKLGRFNPQTLPCLKVTVHPKEGGNGNTYCRWYGQQLPATKIVGQEGISAFADLLESVLRRLTLIMANNEYRTCLANFSIAGGQKIRLFRTAPPTYHEGWLDFICNKLNFNLGEIFDCFSWSTFAEMSERRSEDDGNLAKSLCLQLQQARTIPDLLYLGHWGMAHLCEWSPEWFTLVLYEAWRFPLDPYRNLKKCQSHLARLDREFLSTVSHLRILSRVAPTSTIDGAISQAPPVAQNPDSFSDELDRFLYESRLTTDEFGRHLTWKAVSKMVEAKFPEIGLNEHAVRQQCRRYSQKTGKPLPAVSGGRPRNF